MLNIWDLIHMFWWPIVILAALGFAGALFLIFFSEKGERDLSKYVKRQYLFDAKSELDLFRMLIELYGDRFHVFPQVHYSHLVEVRKGLTYSERMSYWNAINRKSADFVLCDREQVVPQLVIELDGSSHEWDRRQERDRFINDLMKVTGLPILHLTTASLEREHIKNEVDKMLAPAPQN